MSSAARRRVTVGFLALLLFPTWLAAQDQRAVLELVVNSTPAGEAMVVLREADALISVSSLNEAGVKGFEGRRETVGGFEMVSLASLAPQVTYTVDETNLRLVLTADPAMFSAGIHNLWSGAPAGLEFRKDSSAFVNYSLRYNARNEVDLFTESAISAKGLLVYTGLSANSTGTTRGITNVTHDEQSRMRRWTFGDSLAYGGPLAGDAWLAGVTVARDFGIDPYFNRHPTLSLSTPITVPSVMEVHVNGQVVRQEPVSPGRLDVTNVPMTIGRNDARIVIRDAFGETRDLSSSYYMSASALAAGIHDYQYSVGVRRHGVGTENWSYGKPVALARHRYGITDSITLGGRAELESGKVFSGGPTLNLRLPFGEVEAAGAMSRSDAGWGGAGLGAFTFVSRAISAGGAMMVGSDRYATLSTVDGAIPATLQANVFASAALGGSVSLTLQHAVEQLLDEGARSRTGLLSTFRVGRQMELSASATRTSDYLGNDVELYAGLTVLFSRASMAVAHTRNDRGGSVSFEAQQPVPAGVGYGAQVRVEQGVRDEITGVARYQGPHGSYELRQESFNDSNETTLSAMGAIVAIGGGVHATRPVQDSYALIRVPGVEGVRGYFSNQEIGRTSRSGELLVPNLQAYYANTLDIADADIPLLYSVNSVRRILAPPYRGGAVAEFSVLRVQRILGKVVLAGDDTAQALAFGELVITVGGQTVSSPIGVDGSFYFENVPAGTYAAVATSRQGECEVSLIVPSSDDLVVKLGLLQCKVGNQ